MTDSLKILNSQGKDNVFTLNEIPKILINFKIKDSKSLITCLTFLELFLSFSIEKNYKKKNAKNL